MGEGSIILLNLSRSALRLVIARQDFEKSFSLKQSPESSA